MPAPSIKSRPVYGTLMPRPGRLHLLVADAEGAEAVLDLATRAPAGFFDKAHIIYVPGHCAGAAAKLAALKPAALYEGPTIAAILPRLTQYLVNARMGTQLYLAGTETLIGQAMKLATDHGIPHAAIPTEHRGSLARRVQCVHCKGITENVTTQPVRCGHCGLMLLVRDHYSRRLAAFQGVCIEAEAPGSAPPMEEVFP